MLELTHNTYDLSRERGCGGSHQLLTMSRALMQRRGVGRPPKKAARTLRRPSQFGLGMAGTPCAPRVYAFCFTSGSGLPALPGVGHALASGR